MKQAIVRKAMWPSGYRLYRTTSHRHFEHPNKPGLVTIAGKPSKDLPPQTWISILKQAGLR